MSQNVRHKYITIINQKKKKTIIDIKIKINIFLILTKN